MTRGSKHLNRYLSLTVEAISSVDSQLSTRSQYGKNSKLAVTLNAKQSLTHVAVKTKAVSWQSSPADEDEMSLYQKSEEQNRHLGKIFPSILSS